MSKTWITSDCHFGHTNIMKFCPETRGRFKDVDHMNETMIREWNEDVAPEDTVYILGDFAFLPAQKAVAILNRLNGSKILIEGNHDRKLLKDPAFRACFTEVHKYHTFHYNNHMIVMFHFPIHFEWDQAHRGSVHFFGHVHGHVTGLEKFRARDVGVDATGKVVTLFDDILADALTGILPNHH